MMTESEWRSCGEPDLLLEELEGRVDRAILVEWVRRCWDRVAPGLVVVGSTPADEYAALSPGQSDHDAVVYADEAALRASRYAADMKAERRLQADLLRQLVSRPE
ncbi:MAG: hypothetical protein K2W96_22230 [Gemmataceae bacterium]|nr:hypothetical protein [Gemmataceae bacterium]